MKRGPCSPLMEFAKAAFLAAGFFAVNGVEAAQPLSLSPGEGPNHTVTEITPENYRDEFSNYDGSYIYVIFYARSRPESWEDYLDMEAYFNTHYVASRIDGVKVMCVDLDRFKDDPQHPFIRVSDRDIRILPSAVLFLRGGTKIEVATLLHDQSQEHIVTWDVKPPLKPLPAPYR